jgi:tRNA A-37 threonylcarbamoyl transferase component Bud32
MAVGQTTVVSGESTQGKEIGQSTVVTGESTQGMAVGQSTGVREDIIQGMAVGQTTVVSGESTQGKEIGQSIVVREESTQGMEIGQFTVVTRESTKGMGGEQPSLQLVKPGPSIKGESSGSTSVKSTLDKLDIVVEGVVEIRPSQLRYIEEINKGAFGIVYKAVWNETTVAVKKIPVKRMKKSKHLLERELKVNSSIRHPSIVLFLGYHVGNNEVQLVTEYMNGPNLEQVLFEESELDFPLDKRISTGYQICSAVSYLHSRIPVILHRDIKPENVVLSKCLSVAKLCDMGLSKFKSFTTVITTMAGGTQPGTAAYKAPEVFLYNSSASLASDVWSLSATLVELLTDEVIWANSKNTDSSLEEYIFTSMKHEEQPDGLKCLENKDIPIQIKEVVSTGLEYRVSARPAAVKICEQFREMLRD